MTNPQRIVSILDMLKIYASQFVYSMECFGRMGRLLVNAPDEQARGKIEEDTAKYLLDSISDVSEFLSGFHAPATVIAMADLKKKCEDKNSLSGDVGHDANQVFERFHAELGGQWLLVLSHEHSEYLNDDVAPFGKQVGDKFPTLNEDIEEAAKCLALSRYTSSVFHLMRVMEATVHLLAKKLAVAVNTRIASWNEITTAISNALNSLPGKTAREKRKKQLFGDAVANLTAVRIAWWNDVMHPKKTYTKKEAVRIFNHVEGFLTSLLGIV